MARKKNGKIIVTSEGLEGFVYWVDSNASNLGKEREDDMSSLVDGLSCECASGRRALRERLPSTLKYLTESAQSGLAQMKRLRIVGQ